jgi:lysozyme
VVRKGTYNKPDYIKWMLWTGAVIAIAALVMLFLNRQHIFHVTPKFNLADYPVRGIDVSNHNGSIQWKQVARAGYQFAYIKASEGRTHRDNAFKRNVEQAHQAGMLVGAYHFFRKNRGGIEQAQNFLNAVQGLRLDLPLAVDVEDWDNDNRTDEAQVRERLVTMVNSLLKTGRSVMIYTNGNGYDKYYSPNFPDLDLWLCSFRSPDALRKTHSHRIQQYSHWGEVPGVKDDVDLNVFMGSQTDWEKWLESIKN